MTMTYKIVKHVDWYSVENDKGECVFYSNDGYITDQTDVQELKEELVILYAVMDDTDTLCWA